MKNFRAYLLAGMLFIAQLAVGQDQQAIDSLAGQLGEKFMKNPQAVGFSIAIYSDGKDHFYNFGSVEKGKPVSPTQNTLYEIGSVAKTFTSYLLAKAILEKKIALEDDIRKYLDGPYPNLEYNGQPVKIVHLANATAGLPDWLPPTPDIIKNAHPDSVSFLRARIYAGYTRKDFYDALREVKLDAVPGSFRKHSNAGGDLLTYILESVYKKPWHLLVEEYVFKYLKMKHSAFTATSTSNKNLAKGYNGSGLEMPYMLNGFSSSPADLLKYIKAHLERKDEITKLILTKTANIDLSNNKVVQRDTSIYSVGLNWFSYKNDNGLSQTWYDGGTHGFLSYVVFYPELNTAVVLLANVADEKTYGLLPGMAYEIFQLAGKKWKK